MIARARHPLVKVAFATAILLVFLLGAEAFCRIVKPDERWFRDPYANQGQLATLFKYDYTIGWTGRPGAKVLFTDEHLNSRGLRGPEFPDEKPPSTVRIAALGDSCTFQIQMNDVKAPIPLVELDDPYPAVLNLLLSRYDTPERRYEVVNGGMIGYSTLQGLRFMRKEAFRWQPDVILIKFGWNDQWIHSYDSRSPAESHHAALRWVSWRLLQSRFYALLSRAITTAMAPPDAWKKAGRASKPRWPGAPPINQLRVPPEEFAFHLRLMIREARAHGAVPILLTAPMSVVKPTLRASSYLGDIIAGTGYGTAESILAMHARYNAIVVRVAREEHAPCIDLDAAVAAQGRGQFFGTTELMHPNARASWLTAELVLEELQHLGIVPPEEPPRDAR